MAISAYHARQVPFAAALLCFALVPHIITAQHTLPHAGGRGQFGLPPGLGGIALERLSRELALTDEQKAAIDALLADQRDQLRVEMETLRQARQALDAAVLSVPTDDGLLQAEVQQIATVEAQLTLAHARTQAKIFQLLNAEQQAKARQLMTEMEQRGPRRGGRG
jgi:Spy/CpxP family protein refolding chaperone